MTDNPFDALRAMAEAPPVPQQPPLFKLIAMGITLSVAIACIMAIPSGFFLMLSLGIVHSHVEASPALGFLESLMIAASLNLILAAAKD